jgi:Protein of unknown function (DUF2924)
MKLISLEDPIRALDAETLTGLRGRWKKQYRAPPSKHISRKLLIRALAYEVQVKAHGGLKASTRRKLLAIAKGERVEPRKQAQAAKPPPGTRLLREWHGKTFVVEVTEGGFNWEGDEYSSLSSAAHAITGAKWNGRRFFGLPPASSARPPKEEAA